MFHWPSQQVRLTEFLDNDIPCYFRRHAGTGRRGQGTYYEQL
jgi:hypothetical protein